MTDRPIRKATSTDRAADIERRLSDRPSTSAKWVTDGSLAERLVAEWAERFPQLRGDRDD